jgi:hypothetical protein
MVLPYEIMLELLDQRAGMKPRRVVIAFLGDHFRSANEIFSLSCKVVDQISLTNLKNLLELSL